MKSHKIGFAIITTVRPSFAGAWIEIFLVDKADVDETVAPSRERGLKYIKMVLGQTGKSRSFAGAWIEIQKGMLIKLNTYSRSFAGAWIEILYPMALYKPLPVAPSRERGLKCLRMGRSQRMQDVAPSREHGLKYQNSLCSAASYGVAP